MIVVIWIKVESYDVNLSQSGKGDGFYIPKKEIQMSHAGFSKGAFYSRPILILLKFPRKTDGPYEGQFKMRKAVEPFLGIAFW